MCSTSMPKSKVHLHNSLFAEKEIKEWKKHIKWAPLYRENSPVSEQKRWPSRKKKIFPMVLQVAKKDRLKGKNSDKKSEAVLCAAACTEY